MVDLPGEGLLERARDVVAAVQVDGVAAHERRVEEGEALDVVPVHVAEEDVRLERHLGRQLLAEEPKPRAAVQDQDGLPRADSTQLVLPPVMTVSGPGAGMLPRTPQKVTRIASLLYPYRP